MIPDLYDHTKFIKKLLCRPALTPRLGNKKNIIQSTNSSLFTLPFLDITLSIIHGTPVPVIFFLFLDENNTELLPPSQNTYHFDFFHIIWDIFIQKKKKKKFKVTWDGGSIYFIPTYTYGTDSHNHAAIQTTVIKFQK